MARIYGYREEHMAALSLEGLRAMREDAKQITSKK